MVFGRSFLGVLVATGLLSTTVIPGFRPVTGPLPVVAAYTLSGPSGDSGWLTPVPHLSLSAIESSAHHNTLDCPLESKAGAPPQADFPREVENDVHVLSLLQEACGGASEAVRRERRPRMTDSTPSSRTRPVMADQKGA